MKTAITYRQLEEWSHDELLTLEKQLWEGARGDTIDFDDMRSGDPSDGFGAAPNYGTWLEHFVTEVDRVLTGAGYPKITAKHTHPSGLGHSWTRSVNRLRALEGGSSE